MTLSYDRRAPEALLEVLSPGGWARSLVDYGRAQQYALDLQLRGYADKPGHWATLYVGLTKVLDLHWRPNHGFRLHADKTYRQAKFGWQPKWERSAHGDQVRAEWPRVEDYLERVIPTLGRQVLGEGAVQSAISGFAARDLVVIDREAVIAFSSNEERKSVTSNLAKPVLAAVGEMKDSAWHRARPKSLGGECDALAVTRDGRLLVIEVKPPRATSGITWAPLQARHYANLFSEWIGQATNAPEILRGMVAQRVQLGLAGDVHPRFEAPIRVEPVIAIARGYSDAAITRLATVQQRLVDAGLNDPPLKVCSVSVTGRLDPIGD